MDIKNLLCPLSNTNDNLVLIHPIVKTPNTVHDNWSLPSSTPSGSPSSSSFSSPPTSPPLQLIKPIIQRPKAPTQTRTPWTPEEDLLLQQGFSQGMSWAMISSTYLPYRSRGCCWGRFKTLQAKVTEQRAWSDNEDQLLLLAIKKHAKLFKHAWKSVAQDLENRTWRECEIRSTKASSVIRKKQRFSQYLTQSRKGAL
ncbi:hypothetical protein EC973_007022 [Apophysomyces ossiformis]|uniref:Myb-like domain-containing protein n=1 Tax=Apophysomyces ossiformis TaxID=679940 RepID=A0A8H7BUM5_9FUNG|nr:hypothetical protein EC973_007022 [Apophysomyces ossiformis]